MAKQELFYRTNKEPLRIPKKGDPNHGESMTVQGEDMSIDEIMKRHGLGQMVPQRKTVYLDTEDVEMVTRFHSNKLDLTDLDALKEDVSSMSEAVERAEKKRMKAVAEEEEKRQLRLEMEEEQMEKSPDDEEEKKDIKKDK